MGFAFAYYRLRQDRLPNKFRNKIFDNGWRSFMKLEKAKSIAEVLMWLGLVPQWIFMTSRGVPGGLLIAIFIMPILMIMTFISFMMYVFIALEEKSFKNNWWQLLLTGAWLTFLLLLFTGVIRY